VTETKTPEPCYFCKAPTLCALVLKCDKGEVVQSIPLCEDCANNPPAPSDAAPE